MPGFLFGRVFGEAFFQNRDPADDHNRSASDEAGEKCNLDHSHNDDFNSHTVSCFRLALYRRLLILRVSASAAQFPCFAYPETRLFEETGQAVLWYSLRAIRVLCCFCRFRHSCWVYDAAKFQAFL